ncbi:choline/ethanolaminephosphotransferase 1-like [Rhipicephalus microplus]|uniref:choline/ethanolaminephosphotransferase 1-like n=1 Tax=Rhipicephalus microplus TaxID=6941 RepID=UPI003F6AA17D
MHLEKTTKTRENFGGWVLPVEQMDNLKKKPYLYNASAGSVLELLFLQRFWMWCLKFVPERTAPCLLTCSGLVINVCCCLLLLSYSSDLRSEAPWWTFVLCALSLFLYQLLDALDGKQAIKVQNTPLEEVYDHGCDALSTFFVTTSISIAMQLGDSPALLVTFFFLSVVAFYSTHWQDYVTHVMIFGKIDVSECQCSMMAVHLLTAIYGQKLWTQNVFYGIQLREILMFTSFCCLVVAIFGNVRIVLGGKTPLDGLVKIPRRTERTLYPMAALLSLSTCLWATFKTGLMIAHPVMFLVTYGFAFAKITIRLVLTTVSYGELDLWDSSLVAPLFLCLNALLSTTPLSLPISSALMCAMVYSVMDFARYFTYASWDMRDALDVWIFSLKYPVGDPRCRNGNNGVYLTGLNNEELLKKTLPEASAAGVGAVSSNGTKQKGGKLRLRKYLGRSVGKECLN